MSLKTRLMLAAAVAMFPPGMLRVVDERSDYRVPDRAHMTQADRDAMARAEARRQKRAAKRVKERGGQG